MLDSINGYAELAFLRGVEQNGNPHHHGADRLQEQNEAIGRDQVNGNGEEAAENPNDINRALGAEDENKEQTERVGDTGNAEPRTDGDLTEEEKRRVQELKAIDQKVRQHEMAHLSAASGIAVSGASFEYERGPDGVNYAVAGEVSIDTSAEGDPEKTIDKARKIAAAATAPADPSPQDRQVAAQARGMEAQAQVELQREARQETAETEETRETQAADEQNTTASTAPTSEGTISEQPGTITTPDTENQPETRVPAAPQAETPGREGFQLPNAGIDSYLQNQSFAPSSPLLPEFEDLPSFSFANQTIQPVQPRNNLELVA
jgi:hypothetical protein